MLSVLIPTLNEGRNIIACLQSVGWADEVVVVDSGSSDGTQELARRCGAQLVDFRWNGRAPKKKNWALENVRWKNEWLLILDADERVTPALAEEIQQALTQPATDGYFINRRFMFLGKWLKHAYYPNWNLRLFKHALGRFEKLVEGETDSGDVEIHEHVLVNGPTGHLQTELEHYAFPSVECFIEKHNRYSNWEAQYQLELGAKRADQCLQDGRVNLRRRLKLVSRNLPMRPFLRFFYVYILQRGFLDGLEGYYFARLHACYEWMSVVKTYERKRHANRGLGN